MSTTPKSTPKQERIAKKFRRREEPEFSPSEFLTPSPDTCATCGLINKHCQCVFEIQSGMITEGSVGKTTGMSVHQNVGFEDGESPYLYDLGGNMDPTRNVQDTDEIGLENFFKRPILVSEFQWDTGFATDNDIDVWNEFFLNPRVANRINNYKLLKCDLHVKTVLNGNSFHYGRLIASYLPLDGFDDLTENRTLVLEDIVQSSQRPHYYLDPTTSQGGEMTIPMFFYNNYMDITAQDWSKMGLLNIRSLNELKHANGATDKVTVSTFVWAENVKLAGLTSRDIPSLSAQDGEEDESFEIQSGEVDEANKAGFISKPASAVAAAAGMLGNVPVIGPFAMATQIGATAIGAMAKLFGYSRPVITAGPEPFTPRNIGQMAPTNVPDTCLKLTVDDKQELSIDPRIAGIGPGDPLAICSIAKRESYLTTFTWAVNDPPETLLWNSRVEPVIWAETGSPVEFHFPACAIAALPFKYWTGSMRFRFQVVSSGYHKGRLKFVYDPDFVVGNEYNINYVQVIDIADTRDFTLEVGNGQPVTLIDHHNPGVDAVTDVYDTSLITTKQEGNGVLGIYILNELTVPNSTINNDIEINVFVSAGDDFEVFVPEDKFANFVFKPQSGEEESDLPNTSEPSAPMQMESMKLGPDTTQHDLMNKVYTGECITSFRQMLKRYNLHTTIGFQTTDEETIQLRSCMFPFLRGNVSGAINTTGAAASYNYCNTVLLHWVTNCYSGWRGSIRYKLIPKHLRNSSGSLNRAAVERTNELSGYQLRSQASVDLSVPSAAGWSSVVANTAGLPAPGKPPFGYQGMALQTEVVNDCLEFEVPFYAVERFHPGKQENWTTITNVPFFDLTIDGEGSLNTGFDLYCATGEDFQTYFWTGCPPMYFEASPPAP